MVFLVSSGNLINLFLGWEMIGLTSFFLINFWSSRVGTLKAAFKAYSFNKTSDLFLFVVIVLIFNTIFTLDIPTILNQIYLYENYNLIIFNTTLNYIEVISVLFLICAFIKSAQFGAHIWLPDSMEAPVPASALIHSATLVSAGIYLLLRFTPMFELSEYSLSIVAIVGSITAFYGGFTSMFQSDAKRILAYSTISHCGFLMVIYSTGVIEYTILYLYVHGFFKAATFLCVGNIIRFSRNTQDFKRMGGYAKFLPADTILTFVCMMNLSGLPLTFGFFY
jgi:NADH-quinone oxidoreductase subunit L